MTPEPERPRPAARRARRIQMLGGRPFRLPPRCANCDGYGLHAGVVIGAGKRAGLERLGPSPGEDPAGGADGRRPLHHAEATLGGRHDGDRAQPPGTTGAPGRTGSSTAREPDPLPRGPGAPFGVALGHSRRFKFVRNRGWVADSCITNAQVALGWRYQTGSGVAKDLAEAVRWYRKAAQQGTTDAQRALDDLAASTGR